MAELSGHRSPDRLQHLLLHAIWEARDIGDDVCRYVTDAFAEPDAVLVVDESGDVKKGTKTVGGKATSFAQLSPTLGGKHVTSALPANPR